MAGYDCHFGPGPPRDPLSRIVLPKLVAEPATEQAGGKAERLPSAGDHDIPESSPKLVLSLDFWESMEDKNRDSFKEIDHKRLSQPDGAKYLVDYLENLPTLPFPMPVFGRRTTGMVGLSIHGKLLEKKKMSLMKRADVREALDTALPPALPDELVGWILLRRAALTSAQRLNVLASIHNSLHSADVERGLRAVEEELAHPDQSGGRKGKGGGKGRSFWVEEDGEWGIFMGTEMEVEDFVDLNQVHWVNKSPMQDYPTKMPEHTLESVIEDGKGKGGKLSGSYFVESHLGIFMLREEQIELEEECEGQAHGEIRFDPDLNGMTESEIILDPAQKETTRDPLKGKTSETIPASKGAAKAKVKTKPTTGPQGEKFDYGRQEARPGRGSVSGSNAHATWTACAVCKLRLSYTAAYGAHAMNRQAGPFPSDTKEVVESLGNEAAHNPLLKNQAICLEGAERSLMKRLEVIKAQKAKAFAKQGYTEENIKEEGASQPSDAEELKTTPGRKMRKNEITAEEQEYDTLELGDYQPVEKFPLADEDLVYLLENVKDTQDLYYSKKCNEPVVVEEGKKKGDLRRKKSKALVKRALIVARCQLELGGEVAQEWPRWNYAWKWDIIEKFWTAAKAMMEQIESAYGAAEPLAEALGGRTTQEINKLAETVHHFLLYLDEASGYVVTDEIVTHPDDQHENVATPETLAQYKKQQDLAKLSRATNSRAAPVRQFLPGDLVYYKRFKTPRDRPARCEVDVPRLRVGRWFGPGRVLAAETRVREEGLYRSASSSIWIISQGRLKKVHRNQLRHASETERLIAENTDVAGMPWTFTQLVSQLNKGEFDDLTQGSLRLRGEAEADFGRSSEPKIPFKPEPDEEDELIEDPESRKRQLSEPPTRPEEDRDIERLLSDPNYDPLEPYVPEDRDSSKFRKQRAHHEAEEMPLHAWKSQPAASSLSPILYAAEEEAENGIFGITIQTPATEIDWKTIVKNPAKFAARNVQKGAEVEWRRLSEEQRRAMKEAKQLEVDQWIIRKVCAKADVQIPANRLMRMRWVLTFKAGDSADYVKAKARIVRGKMLLLNLATHRRWDCLKANAKSAFLQGSSNQAKRNIFAVPVEELSEAMGLPRGQAVRLLKAAYGLASAPREWFLDVCDVMQQKAGLIRLQCDPCLWIFKDNGQVVGAIGAHVDDFLITGDETNAKLTAALDILFKSFAWSPWEAMPFAHCGINLMQKNDYGFILDHTQYCEELKQVEEQLHHEPGNLDVVKEINKLCREVYQQRSLSIGVEQLGAEVDEELIMVTWTDAASAEIQSLAEGEQELMFCRALWAELLGYQLDLRRPEDATIKVDAALVIDAKSVYDAFWKEDTASAGYSMKEKSAALELMATQLWTIKYDPDFIAAKKKNKKSPGRYLQGYLVKVEIT
ncbi:unnamed protein product [Effrenium voratum]|nr:unnamed protein product [Effrenium voratum]